MDAFDFYIVALLILLVIISISVDGVILRLPDRYHLTLSRVCDKINNSGLDK